MTQWALSPIASFAPMFHPVMCCEKHFPQYYLRLYSSIVGQQSNRPVCNHAVRHFDMFVATSYKDTIGTMGTARVIESNSRRFRANSIMTWRLRNESRERVAQSRSSRPDAAWKLAMETGTLTNQTLLVGPDGRQGGRLVRLSQGRRVTPDSHSPLSSLTVTTGAPCVALSGT